MPASTGADEEQALVNLGKLTHVGDPLRLGLWRRLLRGETVWTPQTYDRPTKDARVR